MSSTPMEGGIAPLIVVRKYGHDTRIWMTTTEDGSGRVGSPPMDAAVDAALSEQAREGWTLMRMTLTVLGDSAFAGLQVLGDVHPNLQARCEHGTWWDRFWAIPEEAGDEAMTALYEEMVAVLGDRDAEFAWMLMIGSQSHRGDLDEKAQHLLRMVGRPA